MVTPENVTTEEVLELKSQNEFLQKQAEEFADELEKTINSEDDLSKENINLQKQLVDLKTELEAIKTETPERFERLMHGFGNERKEFDEAHEKVYDDNEQLRKALVKINSKVKEFTSVINKEHNASVDMSQIGESRIFLNSSPISINFGMILSFFAHFRIESGTKIGHFFSEN